MQPLAARQTAHDAAGPRRPRAARRRTWRGVAPSTRRRCSSWPAPPANRPRCCRTAPAARRATPHLAWRGAVNTPAVQQLAGHFSIFFFHEIYIILFKLTIELTHKKPQSNNVDIADFVLN